MKLTIAIITYNEEENLERCLSSLPNDAEIIVVDSFSDDQTIEIAKRFGAQVFSQKFVDFSAQKNFALSKATQSWILSIDADEVVSADLLDSIRKLNLEQTSRFDAFKIDRKLHFFGRLLKFGKTSDSPIRLLRRGSCSFIGQIHERIDVKSEKLGRIKNGYLIHYSYRNLEDYFEKFNRYTSMMARIRIEKGSKLNLFSHVLRPHFEFVSRYFFRLGFLDGYPGYVYALNSSLYAFIKTSKVFEAKLLKK